MKRSIATSAVIHILVLICAMLTLSAPAPLETPESTAMDVDIVPAEQMQQGEKNAPVTDHAARKQTTKQTQVANAQNIGDNNIDLKNPAVPTQRPQDENAAAAPKKVDIPVPKDDPRPNDVKTIEQQDTEAAPKEVAAIPQQKPDVTPTPTPTPTPQKTEPTPQKAEVTPTPTPTPTPQKADPKPETENPTEQAAQPPADKVPVPDVKPQPVQPPKTTETKPDTKPEQKPATKPQQVADAKPTAKPTDKTITQSTSKNTSADDGQKDSDKKRTTPKGASSPDSDFNADQIAAMLNKSSSGGGAKRSSQSTSAGAQTDVASLGGKKSLGGGKLSQSEMDGLKGLIQNNWSVVAGLDGASEVRVKVVMHLDKSGNLVGMPEATASGGPEGTRAAIQSSAIRAVMKSAPFDKLPADKYDGQNGWNEVVLNFDASELGL